MKRQLTELVEKIEHNGKEIIPLLEMFKLHNKQASTIKEEEYGFSAQDDTYALGVKDGKFLFSYNNTFKSFHLVNMDGEASALHVNNQLGMFKLLEEYNFDF